MAKAGARKAETYRAARRNAARAQRLIWRTLPRKTDKGASMESVLSPNGRFYPSLAGTLRVVM